MFVINEWMDGWIADFLIISFAPLVGAGWVKMLRQHYPQLASALLVFLFVTTIAAIFCLRFKEKSSISPLPVQRSH